MKNILAGQSVSLFPLLGDGRLVANETFLGWRRTDSVRIDVHRSQFACWGFGCEENIKLSVGAAFGLR
jgi:hypothetical protein